MEMKELINQVLHGDTDAFELIVREFQRKIYTFCYFMLGNLQEAEDAAQEVFFKVRQNLDVEMTTSLQDPKKAMSMTFQEAPWENVEVADDTLAMFAANGTENLLILKYKTADRKVISVELKGDITKEDLVMLAKAYVGK